MGESGFAAGKCVSSQPTATAWVSVYCMLMGRAALLKDALSMRYPEASASVMAEEIAAHTLIVISLPGSTLECASHTVEVAVAVRQAVTKLSSPMGCVLSMVAESFVPMPAAINSRSTVASARRMVVEEGAATKAAPNTQ